MSNRSHSWWFTLAASVMLFLSATAQGQERARKPVGQNMSEMKFLAVPGLPTCSSGSVQDGDPTTGPSLILAKVKAGCSIPWHWHTANEHVMMVSGVGQMQMKDGTPFTLRGGGFALMPTRHIHQFSCRSGPCALFIYADAAFDIHYVDGQESEIPPDKALKAVRETAAKADVAGK